MLYDSTKALLQSILRSLEATGEFPGTNIPESGNARLYEMHQMSRACIRHIEPTNRTRIPRPKSAFPTNSAGRCRTCGPW